MATTAILASFAGLIALAGWGIWSINKKPLTLAGSGGSELTPEEKAELEAELARGKQIKDAITERESQGVGYAHSAEEATPKDFTDNDISVLASNGVGLGLDAWGDFYTKMFGSSLLTGALTGTAPHSETKSGQYGVDGGKSNDDTTESKKGKSGGFLSGLALGILQTLLKILGTVITYSLKFIWLIGAFLIYKTITKDKK